jgi:23S rRNA U2552 (ribose-2'-O)-methylase RlmE/FtsJ
MITIRLISKDDHVINRAYYKMREMIRFFGFEVFPRESMTIACIAESPGGFIQALLDQRVYNPDGEAINTGIHDHIMSISIPAGEPAWSRLAKILGKYKYVHLDLDKGDAPAPDASKTKVVLIGGASDPKDMSGDILDTEVRDRFCQRFIDNKAKLITADGGFEHDKTANTEEMDTHPLLLAEIIMALRCQADNGTFIIKIYDMATEFTINILEILCYCYDEVGLFKPSTSRAASSEKYLVCKRLRMSDPDRLAVIASLESVLDKRPDAGSYYGPVMVPDSKLKEACINYNSLYMKKQIGFIEAGRSYAAAYNKAIRSGDIDDMTYSIIGKIGLQAAAAEAFTDNIS